MKTKSNIAVAVLGAIIVLTLIDTALDNVYLYPDMNYFDLLFYKILPVELINRIIIILATVTFGVVAYIFVDTIERKNKVITFKEDYFLSIINSSPDFMFVLDPDNRRILRVNRTFEQFTGLDRQKIIGENFADLNLWRESNDIKEVLDKVRQSPNFTEKEIQLRKFDTSWMTCSLTAELVDNKSGKYIIIHGQDITDKLETQKKLEETLKFFEMRIKERTYELEHTNSELERTNNDINRQIIEKKFAQDALVKSEEKYRTLLNQIPVGVYRTTPDGHFLQASPALATILGCENTEELMRHSVYDFFESKDLRNEYLFNLISNNDVFQDELRLVTKQGEMIWVRDKGRLVYGKNNKVEFIDGIIEDITTKRNIEQSLYWHAAINSSLAEISNAVISSVSINEIASIILGKACNLTFSKFGMVGMIDNERKHLEITSVINDEMPDFKVSKTSWSLKKLKGIVKIVLNSEETLILNFNDDEFGNNFLLEESQRLNRVIASPVKVGSTVYGIIVLAESINEYSFNDMEAVERMASLLAVASQRFRAEQRIIEALGKEQELNLLKSRFITMVSHEYRTPLQSILLSTQLLDDYRDKMPDDEKDKCFKRIKQSVDIMNNLIDEIIKLDRVESGKLEIRRELVDIDDLLSRAVKEIAGNVSKEHKIIYVIESEKKACTLDETLVRQIIASLCINSIKYSNVNFDAVISTKILEDDITFKFKNKNRISDHDGSPFEPFFNGVIDGKITGPELGLSIIKKTLSLMKGKIEFGRSSSDGTIFKVTIPLLKEETEI